MPEEAHASLSIVLVAPGVSPGPEAMLPLLAAAPIPRMEVLVVEDGIASIGPMTLFPFPVLRLRSSRARGCAASRNRAADRAEGEVLIFPAANRPLQPDEMHALHRHFAENPLLGAVTVHDLFAVRTEVFREHGGFNPRAENAHALELLSRLTLAGVPVATLTPHAPTPTIYALWRQATAWGRFSTLPSERLGARHLVPNSPRSLGILRSLTPSGLFPRMLTALAAILGASSAALRPTPNRRPLLPGPLPRRVSPSANQLLI